MTAPEARSPAPSPHRTGRIARLSRLASVGLGVVMVGLSMLALSVSTSSHRAATNALTTATLADDYDAAARAVATTESLERKYRLDPGPEVRHSYDQTTADLAAALDAVGRHGGPDDRALAEGVRQRRTAYDAAIVRLFAAVDQGDTAQAATIDSAETDPAFVAMSTPVLEAAARHRTEAQAELASLQRVESLWVWLTPVALAIGVALAAGLVTIIRGDRRRLAVEQTRATHNSLHDALTGLPNRARLAERFELALSADEHDGTCTGLLLIDLDRFKEVNDTFGHHYGDELLKQISARLSALLSAEDTVARLGGDEFAVLLRNAGSLEAATAVAARVLGAFSTPFQVEGVELDVEASIGVVVSGEHGLDANVLLQRADVAMYLAKADQVGVASYDPESDQHSPARVSLLGDLRRALDRHELVLHFQPKVRISDGVLVGAEALVRWEHPDRGLILPGDFIPLTEHTGLIGPLTSYVLDSALRQSRAWVDAGQPIVVSVNLSARNLLDDELPRIVADLLAAHGVAAHMLELEVTETAIVTEPLRAQRVLEGLVRLGVGLSLDDFGAGYTSMSQIGALPIDELKIDRCLVAPMSDDARTHVVVRSVIELAHHLGLTVVAEGVESAGTLEALHQLGCDVVQGYHLARPMPAAAFDTWRDSRAAAPVGPVGPVEPVGPVGPDAVLDPMH